MATVIFCDGCDKRIPLKEDHQVNVRISRTISSNEISEGNFDLCSSCLDNLQTVANPKKWVIRVPEPQR